MHTGASKGWPDVAYNFFIDRHGTVWEGRAASLEGPVMPDATGGSQGFAQLCCFVGDHTAEAHAGGPQIDGGSARLARGDLRHRPGARGDGFVHLSRIQPLARRRAGDHDDDRRTSRHVPHPLPGDAAYTLVRTEFPMQASALLAAVGRALDEHRTRHPDAHHTGCAPGTRRRRPDSSAWMAGQLSPEVSPR